MYHLNCDYSEGACPSIMEALQKTNAMQSVGYGKDDYCQQAKKSLRHILENQDCEIHFLCGGTQTNLIAIAAMLRPYEAVICVDTGHINTHETGAIEATGHKILLVPHKNGKLQVEDIHTIMKEHKDEHQVKPKMVYISNSTELGTIYYKEELYAIKEVCKQYGLYFYMDGARLAMALTAQDNDVNMNELCDIFDMFYIGGTKCGALFGEALVVSNVNLQEDLRFIIKQKGALLAKGRLLGIQFHALFENNLYFELAKHANKLAQKLQKAMLDCGIQMQTITSTNQIFPILSNDFIEKLREAFMFQEWEEYDEHHCVMRFVTSWASEESKVNELIKMVKELTNSK